MSQLGQAYDSDFAQLSPEDRRFLTAFHDLSLDPETFDHRSHLRLAWLLLRAQGLDRAIDSTCRGINTFATHHGATGKFHRTITEALVRIIDQRPDSAKPATWADFEASNHDLFHDAARVLQHHYQPGTLEAQEARLAFVPPDRAPFGRPREIPARTP